MLKNLRRHLLTCFALLSFSPFATAGEKHFLYVAEPGIQNLLEYGGHGVIVFNMDDGFKFVKRIPLAGLDENGKPRNVKGICANAQTKRLYVSTTHTLQCLDLVTEKILWEKAYDGGCDRMSLTKDGKDVYLPSLEKDHWNLVDAISGGVIKRIDTPHTGSHNTAISSTGDLVFLCGLHSPMMRVFNTSTREIVKMVGPFGSEIRPYTINHDGSIAYVNVNGLLGFEVADVKAGKLLCRVEVEGYQSGNVKRHGCPSHGIGLTPDEKEIWLCDGHNQMLHIFDATVMPPKQKQSIKLREEPGWITFSIDGKFAWPSSGEVIDVASHKILTTLEDEAGHHVASEKLLEIDFADGQPIRAGDQFGRGLEPAGGTPATERGHASRNPAIQLQSMDLISLLKLYAQLSGRTVLHPELPILSFDLNASATNQAEAVSILTNALKQQGITTILDGDKFVQVFPDSWKETAARRSAQMTQFPTFKLTNSSSVSPGTLIPPGEFSMPNVSLDQAIDIYTYLVDAKGIEGTEYMRLPPHMISLTTQTPLTKTESVYALDTLFSWCGIKVVPSTNNMAKVVRLP